MVNLYVTFNSLPLIIIQERQIEYKEDILYQDFIYTWFKEIWNGFIW